MKGRIKSSINKKYCLFPLPQASGGISASVQAEVMLMKEKIIKVSKKRSMQLKSNAMFTPVDRYADREGILDNEIGFIENKLHNIRFRYVVDNAIQTIKRSK